MRLLRCSAVLATVLLGSTGMVAAGEGPTVPAGRTTVEVRLEVAGVAGEAGVALPPVDGRLTWTAAGGGDDAVTVAVEGEGSYQLVVPDGGLGTLTLAVPGYWAPDTVMAVERGAVVIQLVPTGTVLGAVRVPAGSQVPEALRLRFGPASFLQVLAPDPAGAPAGEVTCPVAEGRLRCELPRGHHDLRFHGPGFASVLRWDEAVVAGEDRRIAPLDLVPGGAILGFVELSGDVPPPADGDPRRIRVKLAWAAPDAPDHDAHRRLGYAEQEVTAGPDGSFQFPGLAAGRYRIEATSDGLAPAEVPVVEVLAGRESRLAGRILLAPRVDQEVRVTPPAHPSGRPWTVRLLAPGRGSHGDCVTGPSGDCRVLGLPAGDYRLIVEDVPGIRWYQEDPVRVARDAAPVEVELPLVPIAGRILRDGDPVRARLFFEGASGGERVDAYADVDGRFAGSLPGEGEWAVSATFAWGGAELGLGGVDVVRPPDGEPFELELEVPDTVLVARVLDAAGRPAPRARVQVYPTSGGSAEATGARGGVDGEGRVRLSGLQPGTYRVRAGVSGRAAVSPEVEVREGEPARVEVRLPGEVELTGRVVTAAGGVAGAELVLSPELPMEAGGGVWSRQVSGPDGRFRARVPEGTAFVHAAVLAPGLAARLFRLPVGDPLEIEVGSWGGTLELRDPRGLVVGHDLSHAGAHVWLGSFLPWVAIHGLPAGLGGAAFALPRMAAGTYRLCDPSGRRCAEGELPPGGHLVLALDDPNPEDGAVQLDGGR